MVLAGDIHFASFNIFDRLICTAVPIFHFACGCTLRKSQQLVPQTDTEHGNVRFAKMFDFMNDTAIFGRVARAVGKHDAIGLIG